MVSGSCRQFNYSSSSLWTVFFIQTVSMLKQVSALVYALFILLFAAFSQLSSRRRGGEHLTTKQAFWERRVLPTAKIEFPRKNLLGHHGTSAEYTV